MPNTPIPVSGITIELSHPAWTPEDETGTAIAGASAGDPQEFATVEGAGFLLDGESGFEEPSIEATSIVSEGEQHSASKYRVSGPRNVTWITPATFNRWLTKYFETVHNDANRRPGTLVETFATDQVNTTTFVITKRAVTYEKGGFAMGAVALQPTKPVEEARA